MTKKFLILITFLGINFSGLYAQKIIDSCFATINPGIGFYNSQYVVNLSSVQCDMLVWNGSNWLGAWPHAYVTLPPPNNSAGCKTIWMGDADLWTYGGEGFGLQLDSFLVPGETYTFVFQYVSHGHFADGLFAPRFYTGPNASMNYYVGNLPAAGYQWVTNSISFTATAQQANHNWIVLSTFPHGTSGMISNLCTSCGYNILNDCTVRLGNDTTLCLGDSYTLDAFRPNANYLWNNQSTSPAITVTQSGWYSVLVWDQICSDVDSIYIVFMDEFDLNQMIQPITCLEDSIVLSSPYPGANYLWFDGSNSQYNTVPDEGSYWVQTNINTCQVTDTITLTDQLCFREIEMPNVFSPNGDGTNDLFLPLSYGGIMKAQMTIYNRWGKVVFSTSDLKSGWDGLSLEGDMCAEGVYFWSINYTNKFRDTYKISGNVTLIRKP